MSDPKTIDINGRDVSVRVGAYASNPSAMAVSFALADTGEPYGLATVNLPQPPDYELLDENTSYLDVNNMPGIMRDLCAAGLGYPAYDGDEPLTQVSGFVEYPLFRFCGDRLRELDPQGYEAYAQGYAAMYDEYQARYDGMPEPEPPTEGELNGMWAQEVERDVERVIEAAGIPETADEYVANRAYEADAKCRWCLDYIDDIERDPKFSEGGDMAHTNDMRRAAVLDRAASVLEDAQLFRETYEPDPCSIMTDDERALWSKAYDWYEQLGGERHSGATYGDMHELAHSVIDKSCCPVPHDAGLVIGHLGMPCYGSTVAPGGIPYGNWSPWATCDLLHSREYTGEAASRAVFEALDQPRTWGKQAQVLAELVINSDIDSNAPRVVAEAIGKQMTAKQGLATGALVLSRIDAMDSAHRYLDMRAPGGRMSDTAEADFRDAFLREAVSRRWQDEPQFMAIAKQHYDVPDTLPAARRVPDLSGIAGASSEHVQALGE